jgi:hypothetical protein
MNPLSGAPPAAGGPAPGPGPIIDTGPSSAGETSTLTHRNRRRSSKSGLLAWYSGGGGVLLLIVIIVLKLVLYGVAETAYERECENVRWEAYDRYAAYGSRDYVTATVDMFHEDCVADATEGGFRRTAKLDRTHYFALMDLIFEELRRQNSTGS